MTTAMRPLDLNADLAGMLERTRLGIKEILWPDFKGHGNQFLRYALKLDVALPKHAPAHRAGSDVLVTAALLREALGQVLHRWPDVQTAEQLIARVAGPCRLGWIPFKSHPNTRFVDADEGLLEWILRKEAGGPDCIYTAGRVLRGRREGADLFAADADSGKSDIPF